MADQVITAAEFHALKARKANKYGAKKVTVDGVTFDSGREAMVVARLWIREKAGEITGLKLQVPYELEVNGVLICKYIADAVFYDKLAGKFRVIDAKGFETRDFKIKKKLMLAIHNLEVECV